MKKTVLTFGLISGVLCSLLVAATVPFAEAIGFDRSVFVGYTIMVASFLLVFFGIRSYRNNVAAGRITFGKAFTVGILITLITCVFYVVTWEIVYFNFLPDFMDQYNKYVLDKAKAQGASVAVLQAKREELQKAKEMYDQPLVNAAITFVEPFPVGLLITLISAAVEARAGRRTALRPTRPDGTTGS